VPKADATPTKVGHSRGKIFVSAQFLGKIIRKVGAAIGKTAGAVLGAADAEKINLPIGSREPDCYRAILGFVWQWWTDGNAAQAMFSQCRF
jgi:hypothetical protein